MTKTVRYKRYEDSIPITIVFLGAPSVGKTAICSKYVYNSFPLKYIPTVEVTTAFDDFESP